MSEQQKKRVGLTRTKEETEKLYPPKAKYNPEKPPQKIMPPKDIKTVDSDDSDTRISKRP